ncbi:MAG: hypothetical protein ABIR30_05380 [Chitinophagaceae bacterium]
MKPTTVLFCLAAVLLMAITTNTVSAQQQYKLRQTTSMMGMKSESTIYVKGMRKRTEGGGYAGQTNSLVTIEQCDKQRTITLNDKKKLFYIQPFSKDAEEVIDEDVKTAVKTKPDPVTQKNGGVINIYYTITDTAERKKMYGFTARHVWTTQKMKPSPDACMMKDSMIIKTDGWYIDLPEFNCPVRYTPSGNNGGYQKPDCRDRFVTRRSGKGKLGFPLIEKRTMIMGGQSTTSEFVTDLETIELTTGKLDSMLFEIPPGYTEAKSQDELQEKFDANAYIKQQQQNYNDNISNNNNNSTPVSENKMTAVVRIGVFIPTGDAQAQPAELQQHLVNSLSVGNIQAIAVASEEEARKMNCDYQLSTEFIRVKQASKVGGLLKAIKNTDPSAASSFNIEASMLLVKLADGSTKLQPKMDGKYEGRVDEAAKKVLDEGSRQLLKGLK